MKSLKFVYEPNTFKYLSYKQSFVMNSEDAYEDACVYYIMKISFKHNNLLRV